jgi:hypothetical protein
MIAGVGDTFMQHSFGAGLRLGFALSICLLLCGCGAQWNTAFRNRNIPIGSASVITVDAKQRHVLIQPDVEADPSGPSPTRLRMCAEPAPDVFAVIAASGSGSIGFDAKSQTGQGGLSISASEAGATIERTQTINLLRESFYRTCERYLNGAISRESFIVQAGRDARAMVAILAIEQLTGAVRRPATIISGPAVAASAQMSNELVTLYAAAAKRRDAAEKAYAPVKDKETADCSKVPADGKAACEAEKAKAVAAKAELESANAQVAEIVKLSGNVGPALQAAASTTAATTLPGGSDSGPHKGDMAGVANAVVTIASQVIQVDDMKLFCIEEVALRGQNSAMYDSCLALLSGAAEFEGERFSQEAFRLRQARTLRTQTFQGFAGGSFDCAAIAANVELTPRETSELCSGDPTRSSSAFFKLSPGQQKAILDQMQ